MLDEIKINDWAEKYRAGLLTESEEAEMKKVFEENPGSRQQFRDTIMLLNAFDDAADRKRIKDLIGSVAEEKDEWQNDYSAGTETRDKYRFRKIVRMAAAAALLIVCSSLTTFLLMNKKVNEADHKNYTELVRKVNTIEASQFKIMDSLKKANEIKDPAEHAFDAEIYGGTGFAITNDGYIATNYHVVKDANVIYVQTADGNNLRAYIVAREPNADIAILKLEDKEYRFGKSALPYNIARSTSSLGQRVFSVGYPKDEIVYNEGYISCERGFEGDSLSYQLEMTANPGQSGSPVLDKYGSVVALVTGKQSNTIGTTYAVHSAALIELIHSLPSSAGIRLPSNNRLNKLERTEQVRRMRDYVVSIKVN